MLGTARVVSLLLEEVNDRSSQLLVIGPDSSVPVAMHLHRSQEGEGGGKGWRWTSAPGRAQLVTHLQHPAIVISATQQQSNEIANNANRHCSPQL